MRTKLGGTTCIRKRRMHSVASRAITPNLMPRAREAVAKRARRDLLVDSRNTLCLPAHPPHLAVADGLVRRPAREQVNDRTDRPAVMAEHLQQLRRKDGWRSLFRLP